MTVAEIKEYIDNSLDKVMNTKRVRQRNKILISMLGKVVSMLDELEPNKQIKWERDIAIQQLNELGYQFGEKIRSDENGD